ncbi:MAG TPA: hypothetical protein VE960_07000, partial [bacterium]|nr:hypothetical protein [bacterium]
VNRAWREDRAGESVTLSALYLRGRYRATETITVGAGYDTRENYHTYETRSIPDSLFTNAARYGARLSGDMRLPMKSRVHVEVGMRDVENNADETIFYSAELSKRDLIYRRMRASLRFTGFISDYATGANPSLRLSKSFRGGHSLNTSFGLYAYTVENGGPERLNQWARIGGQAQLPASLYFSGEYQYDWGDDSEGHRLLGEVGYRF